MTEAITPDAESKKADSSSDKPNEKVIIQTQLAATTPEKYAPVPIAKTIAPTTINMMRAIMTAVGCGSGDMDIL